MVRMVVRMARHLQKGASVGKEQADKQWTSRLVSVVARASFVELVGMCKAGQACDHTVS
jgi:hypothetical protein